MNNTVKDSLCILEQHKKSLPKEEKMDNPFLLQAMKKINKNNEETLEEKTNLCCKVLKHVQNHID